MNIESLFQKLPKDQKPSRAGSAEMDFPVKSEAGRLSYIPTLFGASEIVRIKTGSAYSWGGKVEFADFSIGVLRSIRCNVVITGELPKTQPELREMLAILLKEKFDFNRVFGRALDHAILQAGAKIERKFVEKFRIDPERASIFRTIVDVLNDEKLHATDIQLVPTYLDSENEVRDLVDESPGIRFRARDTLEENAIGYKARLVWGKDITSALGRLAYRGSVLGKQPQGAPPSVLVEHQVQPVETWFRILLAEALGEQDLQEIIDNNRFMADKVRQKISAKLSSGTGRQVETLVIQLLPSSGTMRAERPMQFRHRYDVAGITGGGLEVLHEIKYKLEDRDRWRASGAADPEVLFRQEVIQATKLFLHGRRFEDIVNFYLEQRDNSSPSPLSQEVADILTPIARQHGHRILSSSAILTIPQHAFIDGCQIVLTTAPYSLSVSMLKPLIEIRVDVQIADGEKRKNFASALARTEALEDWLKNEIQQVARAELRQCSALSYFGSSYINKLPDLAPPRGGLNGGDAPPLSSDPGGRGFFEDRFRNALNDMLGERFGLQVKNIDLQPGEDKIIDRMAELASRPIPFPDETGARKSYSLNRDEETFILRLEANGDIFVYGPSQDFWGNFQNSVTRFPRFEEHADAIRNVLHRGLQTLQNELINEVVRQGYAGRQLNGPTVSLLPRWLCEKVVNDFTRTVREQYGLDVRLDPLNLLAVRPNGNQSTKLEVEILHKEIQKKLLQRADTNDEYERKQLTNQIAGVRRELEEASARLEKEISQVETVVLAQNLLTGAILPAAAPPAAGLTYDPSSQT